MLTGSQISCQAETNRRMSKKAKQPGKHWVHPPAALTNGHVVYNVKLLGHVEVDQPKGAEVVRDAVRKMKFSRQLKKSEGEKPVKVELTISCIGVAIQEKQTKLRLHTFPLHRISYCADDKQDKRICAFICKEDKTNKNICYVMDSEKCAEEITLTVGQAFDLAYQKFMQTSGRELGTKKTILELQKKVRELETENVGLRMRVVELELKYGHQPPPYSAPNNEGAATSPKPTLLQLQEQHSPSATTAEPTSPVVGQVVAGSPYSSPPTEFNYGLPAQIAEATNGIANTNGSTVQSPGLPRDQPTKGRPRSSTMPASNFGTSVTGRPRPLGVASPTSQVPVLAPPPPSGRSRTRTFDSGTTAQMQDNPFGQAPFSQMSSSRSNPILGMTAGSSFDLDQQYQDIQEGFASGLSVDDLSLADLDPLRNLSNC